MNYLQSCIEELNPLASLPLIAILFLIAIIAGWYVGSLIQWFDDDNRAAQLQKDLLKAAATIKVAHQLAS